MFEFLMSGAALREYGTSAALFSNVSFAMDEDADLNLI
jgi:hypothetical protein